MALQSYSLAYWSGSAYVDLANVQSINLQIGIQAQLDQIKASTATVIARYPTGYASPITALKSGTSVVIRNITVPASPYNLWEGKISDVSVQYGIPYNGGVGNADYVTINCEGFFGDLGRMNGGSYSMAAGTIPSQTNTATTQSGVSIAWIPITDGRTAGATTVSGTWGDWVARICLSNNARMRDGAQMSTGNVNLISPFNVVALDYNFSDTPTGNDQKYDLINFDSFADNYYTQISVVTESYGTSTVLVSGATKPYRTYQVNTINSSASQATDFANYLVGNYGTPKFAITSFSATAEQQNSFKLDQMVSIFSLYYYPGCTVNVTFRGTTYNCMIEGVGFSATPSTSRFTFYVSGADLNAYLLLNNAVYGKLDSNKLGY